MIDVVYYVEWQDSNGTTHRIGQGRRNKVGPFVRKSCAQAVVNKVKSGNTQRLGGIYVPFGQFDSLKNSIIIRMYKLLPLTELTSNQQWPVEIMRVASEQK